MARLPYLDEADLKPEDRDLLKRPINLHRMHVHSPGMARPFTALGHYIRYGSTLDPRVRELAILQVGYMTKSPYEYSHHLKIGKDFGVTEADIAALELETNGGKSDLSDIDRTVLRAAREMTSNLKASDETFAALKAHFSNEHLVDLVTIIAFYNGVVRFLATMDVDVEPGSSYDQELQKHPLPE
jgi:alkylhydroperoxidase family enzyme